jgi:uncharacterized lipoprotein YmbA
MKRAAVFVLTMASTLASCTSNPEQAIYVMPAATSLNAGVRMAQGTPTLQLLPVVLPDYLDTTDLIMRTGQFGIQASRTGRWGERLSKGVTRSLAADLGHCLQASIVSDETAASTSARIEVTINAFDVTTATSVLAASWTVAWQGDARPPASHHGRFSTSVAPPGGDLAVVAAMAETVAALSDGIAATTHADAGDDLRFTERK